MTTLSDIAHVKHALNVIKNMPLKDLDMQRYYVIAQQRYDETVTKAIKEGVL